MPKPVSAYITAKIATSLQPSRSVLHASGTTAASTTNGRKTAPRLAVSSARVIGGSGAGSGAGGRAAGAAGAAGGGEDVGSAVALMAMHHRYRPAPRIAA